MVDTTAPGHSGPSRDRRRYARLDVAESLEARTTRPFAPAPAARGETHVLLDLEFDKLLGYLLRRRLLIGGALAVGIMVGLGYGVIAPPKFTADTEILIDPAGLRVVSDDLYANNDQRDALVLNVESKMRVLTSGNVISRVVSELALTSDPEFVPPANEWLGSSSSEISPEDVARRKLLEQTRARRDEKSFVVTLSVASDSGEKSVRIADAIVNAFRDDLATSEALGASKTAESLIDRLDELKASVARADTAVEEFKRLHNLQSAQGELASTQSMVQINAQKLQAQARLIEVQSRYDRLVAGGDDGLSAAAQESATISALRTQYATVKQQLAAITATRGPLHPDVQAVMPQLNSLQGQIDAETARIVQAAKTDVEQAEAALLQIQSVADSSRAAVATDNSAQVTLRELEREATSSAAIYESFLARTREITEREQIDTSNIRVISAPAVPSKRSWPPSTTQLAALGGAAGLMLGALAALGLGLRHDQRHKRPNLDSRRFPA